MEERKAFGPFLGRLRSGELLEALFAGLGEAFLEAVHIVLALVFEGVVGGEMGVVVGELVSVLHEEERLVGPEFIAVEIEQDTK